MKMKKEEQKSIEQRGNLQPFWQKKNKCKRI